MSIGDMGLTSGGNPFCPDIRAGMVRAEVCQGQPHELGSIVFLAFRKSTGTSQEMVTPLRPGD